MMDMDGHELEQAPGVGDGQGSLACYSPWGCKELDTTERLNWTGNHHSNSEDFPGKEPSVSQRLILLQSHYTTVAVHSI